MLFSLYTSPKTDIIRSHGLKYHLYADDTQLYLLRRHCVEACVAEIRVWMSRNHLKLNDNKSEHLVFHTRHSPRPDISNVIVGEEGVTPTASCRNIGVVFNDTLTFETHINSVCKTSFWHLRNIWMIRTYLDKSSLEILIHAFFTNKLDYCNSLLTGLPKYLIQLLQPNAKCSCTSR